MAFASNNNLSPSLHLKLEPGIDFSILKKYIFGHKFLLRYCGPEWNNLNGVLARLNALLDGRLTLRNMIHVNVAASLAFLVRERGDSRFNVREKQKILLLKNFCYMETLNCNHLHLITRSLWRHLHKSGSVDSLKNVLCVIDTIVTASYTGKAIAACLMWSVLSYISGKSFYRYHLHDYDSWLSHMEMINFAKPSHIDPVISLYYVLKALNFVVLVLLCSNTTPMEICGYPYLAAKPCHIDEFEKFVRRLLTEPLINAELLTEMKGTISLIILPALKDQKDRLIETAQIYARMESCGLSRLEG